MFGPVSSAFKIATTNAVRFAKGKSGAEKEDVLDAVFMARALTIILGDGTKTSKMDDVQTVVKNLVYLQKHSAQEEADIFAAVLYQMHQGNASNLKTFMQPSRGRVSSPTGLQVCAFTAQIDFLYHFSLEILLSMHARRAHSHSMYSCRKYATSLVSPLPSPALAANPSLRAIQIRLGEIACRSRETEQ